MVSPNEQQIPHTTILQQTTFNIFCQKMENLYNWMDNQWLKVENIVAKGEIAHHEQFLLLPQCFQKSSASEAWESVYMRERVNNETWFLFEGDSDIYK